MRRKSRNANIFNLKLIAVMAGAVSTLLSPALAEAKENLNPLLQELDEINNSQKTKSKSNKNKIIARALEDAGNKNIVVENDNQNLPLSLQKLVKERNNAAENMQIAFQSVEIVDNSETEVPTSIEESLNRHKNSTENTSIAVKPDNISDTQLSLVQKLKSTRNNIADSQKELLAFEPHIIKEKEEERNKLEEGWNGDEDLNSNPILTPLDGGELNSYLSVTKKEEETKKLQVASDEDLNPNQFKQSLRESLPPLNDGELHSYLEVKDKLSVEDDLNLKLQDNESLEIQTKVVEEVPFDANLQNIVLPIDKDKQLSSVIQNIDSTNRQLLALEPSIDSANVSETQSQLNTGSSYLLAFEPFIAAENASEAQSQLNTGGSYLLALEPFIEAEKLTQPQLNTGSNYLLAFEPFIAENASEAQQQLNTVSNYLLAFEPFIEQPNEEAQSQLNTVSNYLLAFEPFIAAENEDETQSPLGTVSNYLLAFEPFIAAENEDETQSPLGTVNNYLLAFEPFIAAENEDETQSPLGTGSNYLLALEPFLAENEDETQSPLGTVNNSLLAFEPFIAAENEDETQSPLGTVNNSLLAFEPFIAAENEDETQSPLGTGSNYLLALEPFLDSENVSETQQQFGSEDKKEITEWFSKVNSTLVSINVFESVSSNSEPPENAPNLIAKNWTPEKLKNDSYNFTSLLAVKPSFFSENESNNSSQMRLAAEYNSFNSGDNRNQELNNNNLLASYSKSPSALPNPEKFNPNLAPNSTQYISQFPKNANNSETVTIVSPTPEAIIDVPATPIIVEFPVGNEVELRVNGELSDRSLIGRTETDPQTDMVRQTWYGVSLQNGENVISAQVIGSKEPPATVTIMVRGGAKELEIGTVETRIPADGISTATIKGILLDKNGNRSNHDAVVTLATTAGEFIEPDFKPGQRGFQVHAKNGEFTATLQSGLEAKTVRIKAKAGKLEAFTQLQFQTALRPSLMTGVIDLRLGAGGTDFYSRFKDFLPEDEDNDTEVKFRSAIFATGAIGEWLVTGAYDSTRSLNEDCNCESRLFGSYQFNEQNYPVYGDSSTTTQTTPSIDSVYLRLERSSRTPGASPDYAMWGDYNTKEFSRPSQQFTSLTRQLHGFKGNYNIGNLQATAFYGNNIDGFQRDTIAPDGTSGLYFLNRRLVIAGSEDVFIELEELNRPGTVLQREQLSRGADYEIDYDRGTILFREPVLRTDVNEFGEVLVRRIVVTYQYEGEEADDTDIYAGRLQYNLSQGAETDSWLAATYLQENQGSRDFELYGVDTQLSLGKLGKIIAEFARSRNDSSEMGMVEGNAVRAEAEGEFIKGLRTRAYYRFADTGFANNATISFVPGQTRYGVRVNGKITSTTNLNFQYDHENNFGIAPQPLDTFEELFAPRTTATPGNPVDNSLTTISAGIQQRIGKANLSLDLIKREREDRISPETLNTDSTQLRSRLNVPIAKKFSFVAQNETSLSNNTDAVYPDRTILGINWEAIPGINLSLTQQFYTAGQFDSNSVTSFNVNGEHKFSEDTSITGRFSVLGGADGATTQGALGLKQGLHIAPGLRLNLAYERVFGDFFGNNGTGQQFRQPFAVGQSAAALGFSSGDSYSVGLEYTDNPNFKASALFERRNSTNGNNTVISAGVTGNISPALTALVRYKQTGSSNQSLRALGDTANLRVGLAYRNPKDDKFNALLRYEYRKNPSTIPDTILFGTGTGAEDHTFGVEAIYAPNWQWEFYGKYALRNSTTYLADDFSSNTISNLGQLRATYRLGYSWDLVGEARLITQSDYTETGLVIEAGYYITPNLRIAGGFAFGEVDDRDFSGTRSASGPYLGISMKLNELFNGFGLQKRVPRNEIKARQSLVNQLKKDSTNTSLQSLKGASKTNQVEKDAVLKTDDTEKTESKR